jgi:hypothetical protein
MAKRPNTPDMHILSIQVPAPLLQAIETAAQEDFSTVSHVTRQSILKAMRERGLLSPVLEKAT